jgi:MFS superfamily sulfate permease-like transporter
LAQAKVLRKFGDNTMSIKEFVRRHPQLTAWVVLALGMVIILIWSARDVGLLPGQWAALIVATIVLAGLCVWIIGWDSGEDTADEPQN